MGHNGSDTYGGWWHTEICLPVQHAGTNEEVGFQEIGR